MTHVCFDKTRIYSSYDATVRIWSRHSGDCLHVLDWAAFHSHTSYYRLNTTPSYLMGTGYIPTSRHYRTLLWDPDSGRLVHHIGHHRDSCLGPIRGKEHTLVTLELDADSGMEWLKIWDVESARVLMGSSAGTQSRFLSFCSPGRFLIAIVRQATQNTLQVWDFGEDSLTTSEDDVLDNSRRLRGDKLGDNDVSLEDGTSDKTEEPRKRKRNEGESFVRRIFRRLVGGEPDESHEA